MAHAARTFSTLVAQVQQQHKQFLIRKGREIIANINPINSISIDEQSTFLKQLPALDQDEEKFFSADLENIRINQPVRNPWE